MADALRREAVGVEALEDVGVVTERVESFGRDVEPHADSVRVVGDQEELAPPDLRSCRRDLLGVAQIGSEQGRALDPIETDQARLDPLEDAHRLL